MPIAPVSFDLSGKLAVVTGCRRGMGLAITGALAAAGADIIGVSAQLEPEGSSAQRLVEQAGRSFEPRQADFADRAQVRSLAKALESRPIDILVNNAGTIRRDPAADHSDADWDYVLEVDLSAHFVLTREVGRAMIERGRGKVLFVASLLSFQGGILVPGYAAAKSGIAGLVKAFANEWAPLGVNVNGIAPGYIATDVTEALRNDPERSASIVGGSRRAGGAGRRTSPGRRCSLRRRRRTTWTGRFCRSMAAGLRDSRFVETRGENLRAPPIVARPYQAGGPGCSFESRRGMCPM